MHRSIAGYNPYNLFILTIDYSKNFTTNKVLTIGHMSMFVVKSIVIKFNGLAYGSINRALTSSCEPPLRRASSATHPACPSPDSWSWCGPRTTVSPSPAAPRPPGHARYNPAISQLPLTSCSRLSWDSQGHFSPVKNFSILRTDEHY